MRRISTQIKKLQNKIEKESQSENIGNILPSEELNFKKDKQQENSEETSTHNIINILIDLRFLKKLLKMIEEGATGFDLAYEVEKNHAIKKLIYDGILFYNNFIEIGHKKFKEYPDIRETNYNSFKTVEKTEKYIFLIWIKEMINNKEELLESQNLDVKNLEIQFEQLNISQICPKCSAIIKDSDQILCENCGTKIRDIKEKS